MRTFLNICCKKRFAEKYLIIGIIFILTSCNITKQLKENEYLVSGNTIKGYLPGKADKNNIEPYIRQKPNRKILSIIPFNVWLYTKIDKEKMVAHKEKRDARFDLKNEKRIARNAIRNAKRSKKGKSSKAPQLKSKDKPTLRESLLDIAEEPVIYDSTLAHQSALQIKKYLFSKGFFYASVSDSVHYNKHRKKAFVKYNLQPGKQYYIRNINYVIDEGELAYYVFEDTANSKLKRNSPFDSDIIQQERERITSHLLNNGYYYFEPDYIYFEIDSGIPNQKIDLTIKFKKFPVFASQDKDSVTYVKHPRYYLNNIYVITENLSTSYKDESFGDTLTYYDYMFLVKDKLKFKKNVLGNSIEFYKGQVFQKSLAEKTYKRILNLGVFRNVLLQFVKNPNHNDMLDCYIICQPLIKQSITIETEGTNTSGNLGIDGSLLFQNRNLLKGAELFELSLNGAIIAQSQLKQQNQQNKNNLQNTFNTIQFGPSARFSVPRAVFPFSVFPFKKDAFPRTYINTSMNYQARPEFSRIITTVNYGFSFKTRKTKWRQDIVPFEVYMVKAKLTGQFKSDLISLNDLFLLNSFQDHITTLSRYSFSYNNQLQNGINTSNKPFSYVKINLTSSGNILRGVYQLTNQPKDTLGRYLITDVPFAQFVKVDIDYRLYIPVRQKNRIIYRTFLGIGKPLTNLNVLPYEQSFFSGGPNSIRAWRARNIGPGGYSPTDAKTLRYDKIGDFIIEGNVEYRFHMFRSFFGAWFVDAGNIWLLNKDPVKPNGEFKFDRFYKEFAVGSGFGLRWDLNFFVLRLDGAIPIADPRLQEGDRWMFDKKPLRQFNLNFAIGYPF